MEENNSSDKQALKEIQDLNKQTSKESEKEQIKGSDADQDNDGDAALNNEDISKGHNTEEDSDSEMIYDTEAQDPEDDETE